MGDGWGKLGGERDSGTTQSDTSRRVGENENKQINK